MAKNNELSLGDRLKRLVPIAIIGGLGATGIAGCGPAANAEKVPTTPEKAPTTASAPATPGASETTQSAAPAAAETTPSAKEFVGGIDTKGLSPSVVSLAEKLTPEKIAAMSIDERTKAAEISYEDIQRVVAESHISEEQAYAQLSFAVFASAIHSTCTPAVYNEIKTAPNSNTDAKFIAHYARDNYVKPMLTGLLGEQAESYIKSDTYDQQYTPLTERCYAMEILQEDEKTHGYPDNGGKPIPPYEIYFQFDPSSVAVLHEGTGHYGEALSEKYKLKFEEKNDFTMIASDSSFAPLSGEMELTFERVVARGNTPGDQRLYAMSLETTGGRTDTVNPGS